MSKQGKLYSFLQWLNSVMQPIGFVEIKLNHVSHTEFFKHYEVQVGNIKMIGNEQELTAKLTKLVIEEMAERIKELSL